MKNRLVLTQCRRSDARLFDLYRNLIDSPLTLPEELAHLRRQLPRIEGLSPINLVSSHKSRVALNDYLQRAFTPKGALLSPKPERRMPNVSQDIWVYPGLKLLSATNERHLRNCWTYEVVEVNEAEVKVKDERGEYVFQLAEIAEFFRLSYARTYHASQGLTFDRVRLWDVESPYFTRSHLITGLSRCTSAAAVDFGVY